MERFLVWYLLFVICFSLVLGLIPANIAKHKGYSFEIWWLYGALLLIVAIVHVALLPNRNSTTYIDSDSARSVADEIRKYKELLDSGAITQEEFEELKKKQMIR